MKHNTKLIEEMQATLDKMRAENELKEEWPNPERVKGRWYVVKKEIQHKLHAIVNYYNGINECFGFDHNGEWCDMANERTGYDCGRFWYSTSEEIKEALVKEAEKRGFKAGVRYKPVFRIEDNGEIGTCTGVFSFEYEGDALWAGYQYIYLQGQWATIIAEPQTIKIGAYVVEFEDAGFCQINGFEFTKDYFKAIRQVQECTKANVSLFGCAVPVETIEDIISRMEE